MNCSKYSKVFIRNQNRDLNFLPFEFMGSFFMLTEYDPPVWFYWSQNQNNTATTGSNPNQSLNTVVSNNAGFSKKLNMILSNYHCLGGEKTQFLSWAILCNVTPVVTLVRGNAEKIKLIIPNYLATWVDQDDFVGVILQRSGYLNLLLFLIGAAFVSCLWRHF